MEGVDATQSMMDHIGAALAGLVFGFGIGFLVVGYLVKPAIHNWENADSLWKVITGAVSFLACGAVAAVFAASWGFYFVGVGLGLVAGCFHSPVLIASHTRETILHVLTLDRAMGPHPTDMEQRAATLLAVLGPPRSSKKTEQEVGSELEAGLDSFATENLGAEGWTADGEE